MKKNKKTKLKERKNRSIMSYRGLKITKVVSNMYINLKKKMCVNRERKDVKFK